MWVCTPLGMFMPALRPPNTVPCDDDRLLQIRSRRIVDLRRLKSEYLPELGDIIELRHTDYEYRAYCTHEQWANAMAKMSMDIDYVKFKEQSERKYGDKKLHDVYTAMWGTVFRLMSTARHQSDYWGAYRTPARARNLVGRDAAPIVWSGTTDRDEERDLLTEIPAEWDIEVPTVTRYPSGKIDHSHCDHAQSKAAKRRCTRRNS